MSVNEPLRACVMRAALPALLVLLGAGAALAADVDVTVECDKTRETAIPAADQLAPQTVQALAACDAEDLYFGITQQRDYAAARRCAYAQRATDQQFGYHDAGILMMIYANGFGTERNLPLARKFACEAGKGGDIQGLLDHIEQLQAGAIEAPLDLCDHRYSGVLETLCAEHEARLARVSREEDWQAVTQGWSTAQRAALNPLRSAAAEYFYQAIQQAGFVGSSARAAQTGRRDELEAELLAAVQRFESGKLPSACPKCFRTADESLNQTYRKVLQADFAELERLFGVTREGVRAMQRKWVRYREALVAFGAVKYPQVPADAWRTYLTLKCDQNLRELLALTAP